MATSGRIAHFRRLYSAVPLFSVVLALTLSGCHSPSDTAQTGAAAKVDPPVVMVATVANAPWLQPPLTGTVVARTESQLGFQVGGRIAERLVERGQQVAKGQLLYRLDEHDLELSLKASKATVRQAEADDRFARENFQRIKVLLARKVVGQQDYDQALSRHNAAAAALVAARSDQAKAERALDYASLKAPFAGTVVSIKQDSGDVVSVGQPVIVLAKHGQLEALVDVPADRLSTLPKRADADVSSGAVWTAEMHSIGGTADPVTRTWPVRYTLTPSTTTSADRATPRLGETVRLTFVDPQSRRSVPISALSATDQSAYVMVIRQDKVHRHAVKVLRLGNEHAVVETDLPVGTSIVAVGLNRLHDGETVRLQPGAESAP